MQHRHWLLSGASIPMGQGRHVPPIFGLGGHYHECPPQYFWSNISYFLSMQYFLDKLKEFSEFSQKKKSVFFSTGCNILRIKSKKRQITFCQGLQGLCSTPVVRPYTVPGAGNCKGGKNEGEWEEDSSGGLIGHFLSPQPWREIDASDCNCTELVRRATQ